MPKNSKPLKTDALKTTYPILYQPYMTISFFSHKHCLFLSLIVSIGSLVASANLSAQQRNYHPSMDEAAVTHSSPHATVITPLFHESLTDVYILPRQETYYLTGTSPDKTIKLWKSTNLKTWKVIGTPWKQAAIAPQMHYINKQFWLVYAKPAGGIVLLKSKEAEKNYTLHATLTKSGTDPCLFQDDDGKVYLFYGGGMLAPLTPDLRSLAAQPIQVASSLKKTDVNEEFNIPFTFKRQAPVTDHIGQGGAYLSKIKGKYYFFANEKEGRLGSETDDVFYVSADHINGPYSERTLSIPHGSQTCVFEDKGKIWATFSGNDESAAIYHKPALLEMVFSDLQLLIPTPNTILEKGVVGRTKYLLGEERMRDPSVTLGGDGYYYAVGTKDFGWVYPEGGIEMWRSKDLKNWETMGFVWTFAKEGSQWMKDAVHKRGDRKMLWAPEVTFIKNNYWLTICLNVGSTTILKSTTGKPEGPYKEIETAPIAAGIDGFLFQDTDEKVYLVWGDGNIARMKDDMSGFAEEPRKLKTINNEHVGYEGNCLVKHNGKYIMTGAEWNGPLRTEGTYDMMYATADNIYGPYSSRKVGVPHGGHGTVFKGKNGEWFTSMFGNDRTAPFRRRLGIIPLIITPDFKIYPNDTQKAGL